MCGIVGLLWSRASSPLSERIFEMSSTLVHRGPDDSGQWVDESEGVALGQRRLAIVDLSPQGHQPMVSNDGRYVIVFNGEIYNYKKIREKLERDGYSASWRGHSDTEVILAGIQVWGPEKLVRETVGMFAMAVWDRARKKLFLARDRVGEKPLYYGRCREGWIFASELKAMRRASLRVPEINREALCDFMQHGYISAPRTIYTDWYKLPPATYLWISATGEHLAPIKYWTLEDATQDLGDNENNTVSDQAAIDDLHRILQEAVSLQMVADVPLGAFLSGGVDSSIVVALMQAQSPRPVRTFTIGFDERTYDEAPFAAAVARHLGTDHTEMTVRASDARNVIPGLARIYDEPFADSSQIPTILVSQLTKKHVTVALSGDGGDELFAGYPRYQLASTMWKRMRHIPPQMRSFIGTLLLYPSESRWEQLLSSLARRNSRELTGRRMHRLARCLAARDLGELYERLMLQWQPEESVVRGIDGSFVFDEACSSSGDELTQLRRSDLCRYLPDDLMVKVDRASMSASLEARAPLLDHRVVERAFALPSRLLTLDGRGKWPLRQILKQYIPSELIDRPKTGFGVPLGEWLRGPLRDWASDLLNTTELNDDGLLNPNPIASMWKQHLSGHADRSTLLWNVLIYRSWVQTADLMQ